MITAAASIKLSRDQVEQVIEAAARSDHTSSLRLGLEDPQQILRDPATLPLLGDRDLSQSLLRGLLVLACFPLDGSLCGVLDVAAQLGLSQSTTHRYVVTLLKVGLLARDPRTRKYRLAGAAPR